MRLHDVASSKDFLVSFQSLPTHSFLETLSLYPCLLCALGPACGQQLFDCYVSVTKQQEPYYSSTLHWLHLQIPSSAHKVTNTNLKTGTHTHTRTVVSLFYHCLSNKKQSRPTLDSIYQPQLGLACVSSRTHLFPRDIWTGSATILRRGLCVRWLHVHGSLFLTVLYVSVCTPLLDHGGLSLKTKKNKTTRCLIFSLISFHAIFHSDHIDHDQPRTLTDKFSETKANLFIRIDILLIHIPKIHMFKSHLN